MEVLSTTITEKVEPGMYRITVPPPLPSARQQFLQKLKLAKTTFDDIKDLQLAAELGRTLLERNEELETEMKQQQIVIDDQAQEIEFLTKQVNSMKEESANRSKIYEQLESSICELEKTNTQLVQKQKVDKKRMQSLCENIEYLERKCEELNVGLQSMRNEQGKKAGGKTNRNSYLNFGSDSSEEEMSSGFGLFRKRSHSLQDLRDYTPSPDEFDSGNSNSPDLKTSESEFIDSLENRIEELQSSRSKETDKVRQLESKIKILVQENANLQQQIIQISGDHEEEVSELRKYVQDSTYGSHSNLNSSFTTPLTSTRRNSEVNSSRGAADTSLITPTGINGSLPSINSTGFGSGSIAFTSFNRSNNSSICKRCAAEIQLLNLVNTIENDENLYDWEFGNPDEDIEFSSLEHELARATGTPYRKDIRFNEEPQFSSLRILPFPEGNFHESFPNRRSSIENSANAILHNKTACNNFFEFASENKCKIDAEEMDYGQAESLNTYFSQEKKNESNPTRVQFNDQASPSLSSSLSTDEDTGSGSSEERMDEDPCLIKDRKPEFSKNKNKSKFKKFSQRKSTTSSEDELKSSSSTNCCVKGLSSSRVVRNPKFLALPRRIPSYTEESDSDSKGNDGLLSSAVGRAIYECCDVVDEGGLKLENPFEDREEPQGSLLSCQNQDELNLDEYDNISECSEASETGTLSISTSTLSIPVSSSSKSTSPAPGSSPLVPEYKQILTNLFSIFNNSKRKYPIPMYPFIQEARRQSGSLMHHTISKKKN